MVWLKSSVINNVFLKILDKLNMGEKITEDSLKNYSISNDTNKKIIDILEGLSSVGMIVTEDNKSLLNDELSSQVLHLA